MVQVKEILDGFEYDEYYSLLPETGSVLDVIIKRLYEITDSPDYKPLDKIDLREIVIDCFYKSQDRDCFFYTAIENQNYIALGLRLIADEMDWYTYQGDWYANAISLIYREAGDLTLGEVYRDLIEQWGAIKDVIEVEKAEILKPENEALRARNLLLGIDDLEKMNSLSIYDFEVSRNGELVLVRNQDIYDELLNTEKELER